MAVYKYDPSSGVYVLVDDSQLIADPTLAAISISTDQADYAPGSTAYFTANVGVGDTVTFEVTDVNGIPVSGTNAPWTVTDGGAGDLDNVANGVVQTSWNVGFDAAGESFVLSAIDQTAGLMATTAFTDSSGTATTDISYQVQVDLSTVGSTAQVNQVTIEQIPVGSTGSSGTGQFPSFLRVHNAGNNNTEQGYNTDGDVKPSTGAQDFQFDQVGGNFTHSVQLGSMAIVNVGGTDYREFRLDLGENVNNLISLDVLKLYYSSNPALTSYDPIGALGGTDTGFGAAATLIWNMDAGADGDVSLKLNDLSSGNGHPDYSFLVPNSFFAGLSNSSYIYLYSVFGGVSGERVDGTFEEWSYRASGNVTPPPTPHATVSIAKDTVCPEDGESVAGKTLLSGEDVKWTYAVTNTGTVGLNNVVVTDDNGTPGTTADDFTATAVTVTFNSQEYNVGDVNHNGILDADDATTTGVNEAETWQYSATGTTVAGAYSNTGTVTTSATGYNPANPPADLNPTAFDISGYTGVTVAPDSITIKKEVSVDGGQTWSDANDPTGPVLLTGYDDPQYRFTITNNSDVSLDIHLVDSKLGIDQVVTVAGSGGSELVDAIGGSPITASWAEGQQTNTATVSATFTDDCENTATASDSDDANYFGANPSLTISKDIICPDDGDVLKADTKINLLKDSDGKVEYRITVTNTGNVAFANPVVTDSQLALGTHTDTGTGTAGDNILDVGETWTYTVLADWVAGGPNTNTADVSVSFTDGASNTFTADPSDSAIYFGLAPHITLDKKTNGADSAKVLVGQVINWTYAVTNDGNVGLTGVGVSDNNGTTGTTADDFAAATVFGSNADLLGSDTTHNIGDLNNNNVLDVGETWQFKASGIAGATAYTNIGTATTNAVSDDCGDSTTPTATDPSSYTPIGVTLAGLTKGYWSTHLTLWDATSGDEKGSGSEINVVPKYDWDHDAKIGSNDLSTLTTNGPSSSLGLVKGANNGGGDSGLLMGDLNHDGLVTGESGHLFFDLASAQILANSPVSGDARIILASQAVAAQLNEYNDYIYDQAHGGLAPGFDASPTGLIEEAVLWLKGQGAFSNGNSKINFSTANDLASPAVQAIINDGAGTDYTLNGSAITFKSTSMSSSDDSWSKLASTGYSYKSSYIAANTDSDAGNDVTTTVYASGEGLKNALAAYNHGLDGSTGGFVISTDGSLIGWQDSLGGPVYDVQANTVDAFWGILEDQNLIGLHPIAGIANHA
ncbi:beta strand repeat-containing protein [Bradyrhizobium liaoningense]|uniref:beta strand repeat-containing protein n=1 Tax=Bradyrhizobium liaoningense TaxID=43992 RepID=UPI001BA54CD3|nr:hypothetical protein [Bradyrhizobium liaoningense]MBR0712174.1 hypothetical protein [Bradyrhizobium liaoningense]